MKISESYGPDARPAVIRSSRSHDLTSRKEAAGSEVEDKVELSSFGADALGDDSISEERIAELRNRIASGTYEVDARKIASKLIAEHMTSEPRVD